MLHFILVTQAVVRGKLAGSFKILRPESVIISELPDSISRQISSSYSFFESLWSYILKIDAGTAFWGKTLTRVLLCGTDICTLPGTEPFHNKGLCVSVMEVINMANCPAYKWEDIPTQWLTRNQIRDLHKSESLTGRLVNIGKSLWDSNASSRHFPSAARLLTPDSRTKRGPTSLLQGISMPVSAQRCTQAQVCIHCLPFPRLLSSCHVLSLLRLPRSDHWETAKAPTQPTADHREGKSRD